MCLCEHDEVQGQSVINICSNSMNDANENENQQIFALTIKIISAFDPFDLKTIKRINNIINIYKTRSINSTNNKKKKKKIIDKQIKNKRGKVSSSTIVIVHCHYNHYAQSIINKQ